MAINKAKNVMIQVTFPKEDASNLNNLVEAFSQNGIKTSKSEILLQSFRDYLKILLWSGNQKKTSKAKNKEDKVEEPHGGNQDA